MDVKFKAFACSTEEVRKIFKLVKELEKEYSCNCTLLEVETKCLREFNHSWNGEGLI